MVVNCAWLAVHLASKGQTLLLDTLTQILKSDASVYMGSLNHDAVPEIRVNAIKVYCARFNIGYYYPLVFVCFLSPPLAFCVDIRLVTCR